jgi:hypothetical protein
MAETDLHDTNPYEYYNQVIATYEQAMTKWEKRVEKILKTYRDEWRDQRRQFTQSKFNILWSNVQTLIPACYAKLPQPDVSRRFNDHDPVGRVAALILERALEYEVNHYSDFKSCLDGCVLDRFLGGRGTAWTRYEPHFRALPKVEPLSEESPDGEGQLPTLGQTPQSLSPYGSAAGSAESIALERSASPSDSAPEKQGIGQPEDGLSVTSDIDEPHEELDYECTPTDYVHWRDFGHLVARTWEEVGVVWRRVYLTREALIKRFGEETGDRVPLDCIPEEIKKDKNVGGPDSSMARGLIYEVWDKEFGCVYWLSRSLGEILDEREDPLELEGFWPCPKPLYATLTTDSLMPVPDFTMYQDQAEELNVLSDRIDGLVKALQVKGVYNSAFKELARIMTEGENNTLIPVDNWQAFAEVNGLKGAVDFVDIQPIFNALLACYQAMEQVKQQVYDITGIADIVRGVTVASETATAQQIKGTYANLRLHSLQEEVASFATDLLRIKAQIIGNFYSENTLMQMGVANNLEPSDLALVPQAIALLKNKVLRNFRIEVAADSMVQLDEAENKEQRMEFLNAVGTYLQQAVQLVGAAPEMAPLAMGLLKFGVRGFKVGKDIEGLFDQTTQLVMQKLQNPAPPQTSPEVQQEMLKNQGIAMKQKGEQQVLPFKLMADKTRANADMAKSAAEVAVAKANVQKAHAGTVQSMVKTAHEIAKPPAGILPRPTVGNGSA